jgi:DNA-directed RNA polymerase subunit F
MTWESILKVADIGPEEFLALVTDIKNLVEKQRVAIDKGDLSEILSINTEIKNAAEFMSQWNMDEWRSDMEDRA